MLVPLIGCLLVLVVCCQALVPDVKYDMSVAQNFVGVTAGGALATDHWMTLESSAAINIATLPNNFTGKIDATFKFDIANLTLTNCSQSFPACQSSNPEEVFFGQPVITLGNSFMFVNSTSSGNVSTTTTPQVFGQSTNSPYIYLEMFIDIASVPTGNIDTITIRLPFFFPATFPQGTVVAISSFNMDGGSITSQLANITLDLSPAIFQVHQLESHMNLMSGVGVQANSRLQFEYTVEHLNSSNTNTNVTVSAQLSPSLQSVFALHCPACSLTTVLLSAQTTTVTVQAQVIQQDIVTLVNKLQAATGPLLNVLVSYAFDNVSGVLALSEPVPLPASPQVHNAQISDSALRLLSPNSQVTVGIANLILPVGQYRGLGIYGVVSSDTYSPGHHIPVDFTSTNIGSNLSFIDYFASNLTETQAFSRHALPNGRRRRRAISAELAGFTSSGLVSPSAAMQVMTAVFGDISVNALGPISFNVSLQVGSVNAGQLFLALGLLVGPAASQLTYPVYNGLSTVPSQYLPPGQNIATGPLILHKMATMEDNSTLPSKVRFTNYVEMSLNATVGLATDVTLKDGSDTFNVFFGQNFVGPSIGSSGFTIVNDRVMTWKIANFSANDTMLLSYATEPTQKGTSLKTGFTYITSELKYTYNGVAYQENATSCVFRVNVMDSTVFYNHGFTVLMFIIGFIVGALLLILIIFILYKVRRDKVVNTFVRSGKVSQAHSVAKTSAAGGLIINTSDICSKGLNNLSEFGSKVYDDSIVFMLSLTERIRMMRELDNWDIMKTTRVDRSLETERKKAMTDATKHLIHSLRENGDMPKGVEEKALSNFNRKMDKMDNDLNSQFTKEMEKVLRGLAAKNKEKLSTLIEKQEQEKEELKEKTQNMDPKERGDLDDLMDKEHEAERQELAYLLKLEQNESAEKLRKEMAISSRVGTKTLQQEMLEEIKTEAKLRPEQADWLMKEHFKNQAAVEKIFDDEISRQRMQLEERLAKRRALVESKEMQEESDSEVLNKMARQQVLLIQRASKSGAISAAEARAMVEEQQEEMLEMKKKMDAQREKQESSLQQKLSERKKKKMEEQAKVQRQEQFELEKKQSASTQTDTVDLLSQRQMLLSRHRTERSSLEDEVDTEDAAEYSQLRDEMMKDTQTVMSNNKQKVAQSLQKEGMSDDQVAKIMEKHDQDLRKLQKQLHQDKEDQAAHFKDQFARRQQQWQLRRQDEQLEQANLRQHEETVVRKLMDNQVSMSEADRDKIMQEHEKQMVKLENSLTLNKLQQKRMLEERLAKKRDRQMEQLQKTQKKEINKQRRDDAQEDEDEAHQREVSMLKQQAQDRLDLMKGEGLDMKDDMNEIEEEMLRERASALKEQEERLGAMLAQLQMEKAHEMARIEEQQKAIHNLKSNLMDDLNEKGLLSDPQCQEVINRHQQEQEALNETLDKQRKKQEAKFRKALQAKLQTQERLLGLQHDKQLSEVDQALRKRMQQRLAVKEQQLSQLQAQQLATPAAASNKTMGPAAKIRKAVLMTQQMREKEKFRTHMEKEMEQTLEDMQQQNEAYKLKALQEQEMTFINGLVHLGKFDTDELTNVVHMLFPTKTEKEMKKLLDQMLQGHDQVKAKKGKGPDTPKKQQEHTLEARVLNQTMSSVDQEIQKGSMKGFTNLFLSANKLAKESVRKPQSKYLEEDETSRPHSRLSQRQEQKPRPGSSKSTSTSLASLGLETPLNSRKGSEGGQSGRWDEGRSERDNISSALMDDMLESSLKKRQSISSKKYATDDFAVGQRRPEPLGRYSPDQHQERDYGHLPASKLPPLEGMGGKKPKKKGRSNVGYTTDDF